jgi:hypothetical protein
MDKITFSKVEIDGLSEYLVTLIYMLKLVNSMNNDIDSLSNSLLPQVERGLTELIKMINQQMQVGQITVVLEADGGIAL